MKYTIISINDDRQFYKEQIRRNVELEELLLPAVDGKAVDLSEELEVRGLHSPWHNAKVGELGVWLSNFDRWQYTTTMDEPLIVFEDDAFVQADFMGKFSLFYNDLPPDWDFAALWVPDNQKVDYTYDLEYNEIGDPIIRGHLPYQESLFKFSRFAAHVYQGYGMVAVMYSPKGAAKLVDLAQRYGVYTPVDCFIYQQAHMGNLNGFAPTPIFASIVGYDWQAASHVQQTERY